MTLSPKILGIYLYMYIPGMLAYKIYMQLNLSIINYDKYILNQLSVRFKILVFIIGETQIYILLSSTCLLVLIKN